VASRPYRATDDRANGGRLDVLLADVVRAMTARPGAELWRACRRWPPDDRAFALRA
jgi:hypothetical protein